MKTNRVRVTASGLSNLDPSQSYVFISNHASHLDSPAIALVIPHTLRFIGKSTLARIPFFGWAARRIGIIFIQRRDPESARRTLAQEAQSLTGGVSTLFYAEGTRSPDGHLQAFKKGGAMLALQTGLPIVPLTVLGSRDLLPKHSLHIRPGTIHIVVGAPISTVGLGVEDRDALLADVWSRIDHNLKAGPPAFSHHTADTPMPRPAGRNTAG